MDLTALCSEPGCRNLVRGSGRCPPHRREHDHERNRRRFWYADPLYRRNRRILLAHARCCELCGRAGVPLTADHIITVAEALAAGRSVDNSLHNLRPACIPCNSRRRAERKVSSMGDIYVRRGSRDA